MVFYYQNNKKNSMVMVVPQRTNKVPYRQTSCDDSVESTISVHRNEAAKETKPTVKVCFNTATQVFCDPHHCQEDDEDRWYSKSEITGFLRDCRQEAAAVVTTTTSSSSRRRTLQQAYQLYSLGLDNSSNITNDAAAKSIGLDRLVVRAHLRRSADSSCPRRKLLQRMDELQDICCSERRARLLAQASHGASEPAVLAAASLAQWSWAQGRDNKQ